MGVAAGVRDGSAPAVFNAANEAAVKLFLAGRIRFGDIARAIASALAAIDGLPGESVADLSAADCAARNHVVEWSTA